MPTLSLQVPVPNKVQWGWLGHTALSFVGGLLVMKGITDETQVANIIDQFGKVVTDTTVLVGMVMPIVTTVMGMFFHKDAPPPPAPLPDQADLTKK